ncbi:GNAT family N-acetyltransferase [Parasedimentitalea huanghaiensis]|uniref:GNAT family N-acetyltransferase n=1 Tax=Parasedimentitalea huanghaiensis TaxID=2682100 RepID=A0A6L6WGN9_9RHOB|nr:GNAT family N-acetyltransferase [Zongyanglinia huanghaiensis]MVO17013.1 GNAT family N-acetyltransferase [Zongyanglinia huanghaiensis]
MAVFVRAGVKADLPAVDALLARSYPKLLKADYPPSVLVTALPIISRARPELIGCGTYYVAEEAGQILGAGGWTQDRIRADKGHIRHVVTDDRALRRGIGRAILSHTIDTARQSGVIELECASTLTAVPFYASVGFESEETIVIDLAPGIQFPAVRMRQFLG